MSVRSWLSGKLKVENFEMKTETAVFKITYYYKFLVKNNNMGFS